ncbi:hypothetical protein HN412_01835 [archaeon]|nr:hypothetical protein [archaeon]MBT7107125.1 hypothetical protein [archaeon]MBT7297235.1 hypothetical protein [archaeon]
MSEAEFTVYYKGKDRGNHNDIGVISQFLDTNLIFQDNTERILSGENQIDYEEFKLLVYDSKYQKRKKVSAHGIHKETETNFLGEYALLSDLESTNNLSKIVAFSRFIADEYIIPVAEQKLSPETFETNFVFFGEEDFSSIKEVWENEVIPDVIKLTMNGEGGKAYHELSRYVNLLEIIQKDMSIDIRPMEKLENAIINIGIMQGKCLKEGY